jgi:hypothetical protein
LLNCLEKRACKLLSNSKNEFCQTLLNKGLCDIAPNVHQLCDGLDFFIPSADTKAD